MTDPMRASLERMSLLEALLKAASSCMLAAEYANRGAYAMATKLTGEAVVTLAEAIGKIPNCR